MGIAAHPVRGRSLWAEGAQSVPKIARSPPPLPFPGAGSKDSSAGWQEGRPRPLLSNPPRSTGERAAAIIHYGSICRISHAMFAMRRIAICRDHHHIK
jgi:hypothetical protein